jgi:hypothetical protein
MNRRDGRRGQQPARRDRGLGGELAVKERTMRDRLHVASLIVPICVLAGCAAHAPPNTIDGYKPPAVFAGFMSPRISRESCIDQVVRDDKMPRESVVPINDTQTMQDGVYVVTLSSGPGKPDMNCTVNENGVVSDLVRAR